MIHPKPRITDFLRITCYHGIDFESEYKKENDVIEFWLVQFTLITLGLMLPILASIRACKLYDGAELPLWLILIWIIPFAGPILCFSITPTSTEISKEKKLWRKFYEDAPHRKHLNHNEKVEAFKRWVSENELDG